MKVKTMVTSRISWTRYFFA